jgi:hypothetical protein
MSETGETGMECQNKILYKYLCGAGTIIVCFVLLLPAFQLLPVGAQPPLSAETNRDQDIDVKIRTFFETLAKGNSAPAFEELLRQSPLADAPAGTQNAELHTKVEELKAQFGKVLNWEKYEVKRFGEDVVMMRYILKYDQYPVMWTFTFYRKPVSSTAAAGMNNPWTLIELHFDTNFY